jgi:hypothetical protein
MLRSFAFWVRRKLLFDAGNASRIDHETYLPDSSVHFCNIPQ